MLSLPSSVRIYFFAVEEDELVLDMPADATDEAIEEASLSTSGSSPWSPLTPMSAPMRLGYA
jgi:hypothetical protein